MNITMSSNMLGAGFNSLGELMSREILDIMLEAPAMLQGDLKKAGSVMNSAFRSAK
jgi:hypothetical protein